MKLNCNFQKGGGGGVRKNPFRGGGMDIFWDYTIGVAYNEITSRVIGDNKVNKNC